MRTDTLDSVEPRTDHTSEVVPRIVSVGVATPATTYTQEEVLEWAQEPNPKIQRLFRNSHIDSRGLYLPQRVNGELPDESNAELLQKHLNGVLDLGPRAMTQALDPLDLSVHDIDFLVCVTSTGFLCPGVTARLIEHLGLRQNIQRADIVGMGCNAAVNALQLVAANARARPGSVGLLLCVEICSAAYVINDSMGTAVVNSLFGDGAAAAVIRADSEDDAGDGPTVVDYESFIHTETIESMKFEMDGSKLSFFLDREIPFVIGANADQPVEALLGRHGLTVSDVDHWVIHSGGKKVIDAISANLGLTEDDVRHTRSVLRDHGNVSSGSVLFSMRRLLAENAASPGDVGMMIAMGPGMSIETALLRW